MTAPTPPIPTFIDNVLVGQSQLNALGTLIGLLFSQSQGGFRTIPPCVSVKVTSATRTVPNDLATAIAFDVEEFDSDNMWTPTTPNRLSVNTAGLYLIVQQILFKGSTGVGHTRANILINGTNPATDAISSMSVPNTTLGQGVVTFGAARLAIGGRIYSSTYQTTGGAATLEQQFASNRLVAVRLCP